MFDHITPDDLASLLRNGFRARHDPTFNLLTRHLLGDCPDCGRRVWDAGHSKGACMYDYGATFAAAERALADFLAQGVPPLDEPEDLLAELAALPTPDQLCLVANDHRFAHPVVVQRFLDESHANRYGCPERMLHQAQLARLAAEGCTATEAGSGRRLADLLAQSWRQFGNSLRIAGRLREAETALATALRFREQGTGDPKLRASLLEQIASLRIFERRFDEADGLNEEAGLIYRELGDRSALAGTMVQRAIAAIYAGQAEGAVRLLNRAIPWIDAEHDPYLLLAACHNLVRCYIDLERPEEALSIYTEVRDLYRDIRDPLIALRAAWQEGKILRDLGHPRAAEAELLQARQGFAERGLFYDAAVVSLDLVEVQILLGAVEEAELTIETTVPIFRALQVDRELLALLIWLRSLVRHKERALKLIAVLRYRLAQSRDRTAVPFERHGST